MKIKQIIEMSSGGCTSSGGIATVSMPIGKTKKRKKKVKENSLFSNEYNEKLEQLKQAIRNQRSGMDHNPIPILNAFSHSHGWAWGDLKNLGLARDERRFNRMAQAQDVKWHLLPKANIVIKTNDGKIFKPGDSTDWWEK